MQNLINKLTGLFGVTEKESEAMIRKALKSTTAEEDLLDLVGESSIEDIVTVLAEGKKKEKTFTVTHQVLSVDEKLDKIFAPKLKRVSTEYYDEYIMESPAPSTSVERVSVQEVSERYRKVFSSHYKEFNQVQSSVFDSVYRTKENVLVCAPTGAGKTDIALLSIVKQLEGRSHSDKSKIIYIAPMKALASEITNKFRHRLPVFVSEYTGDMELTKEELEKSTVLVCTPEKYDVSTRKISSFLLSHTSLIILDEIHILNDSRGPTIEAIVSRLKLASEKCQKQIRMVGISATLPNPKDIGDFLMVNKKHMHVFGPGDRPVPITYSVIGTRKTVDVSANNMTKRLDTREKMIYVLKERVNKVLNEHHQVIVFVHTRGNTLALANILSEDIEPDEIKAEEAESAGITGEMKDVYSKGMFIHNAGLPRSIREFAEEKFRQKKVKVLVSTSTLAWGVNLPARAVIIFGTEIYVVEKGGYINIDILNIQQMFGRAGRPQYDTVAEGVLITDHKSLSTYVRMLRVEDPIESDLLKTLPEKLSTEIYLRNIKDRSDAVKWFKTTFLFIRMNRVPEKYGIIPSQISGLISDYILLSFDRLKELKLIRECDSSKIILTTDLGRIISHYFLSESTLTEWDNLSNEKSVITYLSKSDEYKNILIRSEDRKGLGIRNDQEELTVEKKIEILISKHIQNRKLKGHSLVIDQRYILENIERILGGLSEYFLYLRDYKNAYNTLYMRRQLMKGVKTEIMDVDIISNKHSLLFSRPVSGYIIIRSHKELIKIVKIEQERDCYMTHNIRRVSNITKISSKEVFTGRLEIIPVREYSTDELWLVDSALSYISGYRIEYEDNEDSEQFESPRSFDRKIQFKRTDSVIIEEVPNVNRKEFYALVRILIYERIKEIRQRKNDKIIIIVKDQEEEENYLTEYQRLSFIDNVSFEKDRLCFSSTNGIYRISNTMNDSWTIGICSVDRLRQVIGKYGNSLYIFNGFTKKHRIYSESILRMINTNVLIYEKPNVSDYIKQRYL
ncbi:activating signal cointegrator complex subunit 3 [Nematocida parisii]|nr:activating signal cointegrator complex subunit 3 [Nematocida parisii]KAI5145050.1 activating signal cointegrator complex subunit 3 [Nematocida parisii]